MSALSRRAFLKTAGALVLGVHLPAQGQAARGEINAWDSSELLIESYTEAQEVFTRHEER